MSIENAGFYSFPLNKDFITIQLLVDDTKNKDEYIALVVRGKHRVAVLSYLGWV